MRKWLKSLLLLFTFLIIMLVSTFGNGWQITMLIATVILALWLMERWDRLPTSLVFLNPKNQKPTVTTSRPKTTFEDVAGIDEVIEDIKEIVDFLKNPEKYYKLGARMPKGILLIGPPGVGKTHLARAIAGEAKVPFDEVSGSSFVRIYVGVGADNIRNLFKQSGPRIIFIDEIDALGSRSTSSNHSSGDKEYDQTINEFLVQMDGFKDNKGIIVIGATNRPEKLDEAMLRPGRFDRRVILHNPDLTGRIAIIKVHTRNKPLAKDIDLEAVARKIPGFSGADIANLANEAAISAAKANKKELENDDFQKAQERMVVGIERKSIVITDRQKEVIAYHEAGHALVALVLGETPPTKISVIARGMSLGMTMMEPQEEENNPSKEFMLNQIKIALSGRTAEMLALGIETAGGKNDFEKATAIAMAMVCEYGMSSLGTISYVQLSSDRELGPSEETKRQKDAEIKKIIDSSLANATEILRKNKKALDAMAERLMETENMTKEEIEKIYLENQE